MVRKNIVIIHYNTPLLTERLIDSINKFVDGAFIYVFDNSDKSPFTAKYDNVILLDNTNGQIIDFDKWLSKYPRRVLSPGRSNAWGSAKHCYSVDKCIDIINDNFILLDSDVLLKKDISDLYNEKYIYVGEVVNQPNSSIKRVLPFLCFINVKMCNRHGIRYFDENYMHGLAYNNVNKLSDSYDTGAGFYIHAMKYGHLNIKLNDYIIHYGHGSWDKKGDKKTVLPCDWVEINKKLWTNERNKKVIYTCITGGYDKLIEPKKITSDFDYICFTDNPNLKSDVWEIRELPYEVSGLTQVKKQRYVKLNPHILLSDYDTSIWVDGNVTIKGDLNSLLRKYTNGTPCAVFVPKHPKRDCIYEEGRVVIAMKKDIETNVNPQIDRYKKEGFPTKYGLLQSNIMIRKHNKPDCIKLMECWFNEVENGSHRDQLSFNYACWKNKDVDVIYMDKSICDSEWFKWNSTHIKKNVAERKSAVKELSDKSAMFKKMIEENRKARQMKSSQNITTDISTIFGIY